MTAAEIRTRIEPLTPDEIAQRWLDNRRAAKAGDKLSRIWCTLLERRLQALTDGVIAQRVRQACARVLDRA